jgi:hypothetical protein
MLENIDIKNIISSITIVVTVLIAVGGWYYNGQQNRKHEIFKRSIDARIKLLEDYLLFFQKAYENKSLDGFNKIQVRFYIYGNDDEIKLVQTISSEIEKNKQMTDEIFENFIKLNNLARGRLREELGLSKLDI